MRLVYIIENRLNQKVYVGQTKSFSQRKATHIHAAKRGVDRPLYRSMRKNGFENFEFRILEECDDLIINEREQYWVNHYSSNDPRRGYNLTSGGFYFEHSEETKKKIGNSGHGLKRSEETKKKISYARRGNSMSDEQKEKLSLCYHPSGSDHPMFGRLHDEETKQRMKKNHKGMTGKRHSEETKKKISDARKAMKKY